MQATTTETHLSFAQLDLASIDPVRGAKYSPNLYAFLQTHRDSGILRHSSVYRDAKGALWLGFIDDQGSFNGVKLWRVLTYGRKAQFFCYTDLGSLTEIPDFWAQYRRDGRCVFDRAHEALFIGSGTRWRTENGIRHCQWCGTAA